MRDALYTAGRPVVFSLCEWGDTKPWEWAENVGHLWRTTGDIVDRWDAMMDIFDRQKDLARYAGPGHWNDPDMLEVGNGGMTSREYITHFSLWCMLASPLMAGNDLRDMTKETLNILTNKEMIAINQDPLGNQAFCFRDNGDYEIWIKKLANEEKAVCLLNRSDEDKYVEVNISTLLKANESYWSVDPYYIYNYSIRDVWEHKNLNVKDDILEVKMPPHSVKVLQFVKNK
jgi:alpha-galactosidase